MNDSNFLNATLAYHKQGFSIIPITPQGEKAIDTSGRSINADKQPKRRSRHGGPKWPNANIGLVTGAISGLVVIDLDSADAKNKLKELLPNYDLTSIPRSRTRKGWQLLFQHPGVTIPNRAGIIPGLDVRGDGGYVVAPPSIHPNGKTYKWEVSINGELPKLPVELFNLISSPTSNDQPGYRERFNTAGALAGVPEGQRDETIFRLACKLRSADVPREMAESLVLEAARNCAPPFSASIALEKIERAYRKYEPNSREEKAIRTSHFSLIHAKDLLASEEPETEWLWEGILPAGGRSLLVAKPKVGKTTLAFNLALAVAGGRDFLGRKTKQSPVVYLAATGVKRFTVVSERTRFLTGEEVQNLLAKCGADITSPWLLSLVALALKTGMRQGELLNLKWEDMNFERGVISVMQTKTMRRKTIAVNEATREALNWLNEHRYGDYLLMWPWGDRVGRTTVYDAFKQVCSAAGINDLRFHDLRHTFAFPSGHVGRGSGDGEGSSRPCRHQHDGAVLSPCAGTQGASRRQVGREIQNGKGRKPSSKHGRFT